MKSLLLIVTAVTVSPTSGAGMSEHACVMKLLRWIDVRARGGLLVVAYLRTAVI